MLVTVKMGMPLSVLAEARVGHWVSLPHCPETDHSLSQKLLLSASLAASQILRSAHLCLKNAGATGMASLVRGCWGFKCRAGPNTCIAGALACGVLSSVPLNEFSTYPNECLKKWKWWVRRLPGSTERIGFISCKPCSIRENEDQKFHVGCIGFERAIKYTV